MNTVRSPIWLVDMPRSRTIIGWAGVTMDTPITAMRVTLKRMTRFVFRTPFVPPARVSCIFLPPGLFGAPATAMARTARQFNEN